MPRKPTTAGNLALANFEDIFTLSTGNPDGESIVEIPLEELYPPEFHPFQVNEDVCYRGCEYRTLYNIRQSNRLRHKWTDSTTRKGT